MMKAIVFCIFALGTHANVIGGESAFGTSVPVISGGDAQNFTINLYKTLASTGRNAGRNVAVSPFSIETALSMVFIGASGTTKSELATTLGIAPQTTPESLGNKFKSLRGPAPASGPTPNTANKFFGGGFGRFPTNFAQDTANKVFRSKPSASPPSGYTLNTANKLFLEQTFPILPEFKNNLVSQFESDISSADFQKNPNGERIKINAYVAEKTNNKIPNLLPTGSLDSDSKLVIVNAVYFKADWTKKFKMEATWDQDFSPANGPAKTVRMMHQLEKFPYTENSALGAQLLEMKYYGGDVSMVVILPKKEVGLRGLENNVTPAALESALSSLSEERVDVSFPKFKVEMGFSLVDTLKTMGIKAAFGDHASFPAICVNPIKITKVQHYVFVQVDEAGTEAAAATAVEGQLAMASSIPPPPPIIFNADHPFIFLIRHNPSKMVLFMGRLEDPTSN